jgi:ATP-dependent DNA helicase RecG
VPVAALTRLLRVIDLEETQGWRNRGVIGGIKAMSARWAEDARKENLDAGLVAALVELMKEYDAGNLQQRPEIAERLRQISLGDRQAAIPQGSAVCPVVEASPPAVQEHPHAVSVEHPPAQAVANPPAQEPESEKQTKGSEPGRPEERKPDRERSKKKVASEEAAKSNTPESEANAESAERERTSKAASQGKRKGGGGAHTANTATTNAKAKQKGAKREQAESPSATAPLKDSATAEAARDLLDLPDDQGGFSNGGSYVYVDESFAPPVETPVFRPRSQRREGRSNRSPRDLQAPVTILNGVGEAAAEHLARLGIRKVDDLLWHLPVRHEDYSQMRTISQLQPGEQVTVLANLWDIKERKIGMNRQMVQAILSDGTGTLHATWWNKYVRNQLTVGAMMRFSGKISLYMGQKTLDNPTFEDADTDMIATGRLAPIYRLTEGLTLKRLRGLILNVLEEFAHLLIDPLPRSLCESYDLPDLTTALWQIHFPDTPEQLQAAKRRLAFEEFFYIQLGVLQRRHQLQQVAAQSMASDSALLARFTGALPFALTAAQQRVLAEVAADMRRSLPMTRLIQGDVGSGKTAVAANAMWIAAANGAQSALLAPTQILAEQHHRGVSRLLGSLTRPDGTPLQVALLTGRVVGNERQTLLEGLRSGRIDVVIGTTALIQDSVEFANLGLIVVDEQHRFGVEQRSVLRSRSATQPHLLVMSATPIPRSLALTLYGDLDLSIIDQMPPGRIPIKTKLFRPTDRERLYNFVRREAKAGRQTYIIYPLVEESDKLDVGAAVEAYERLRTEVFPDLKIALLHGRMSGSDKDDVMSAFARQEYQALVSTTVIEVGIDVPNATLIIIEDAERFGLAQLHQLRGRVGRGQEKSYCALISDSKNSSAEERLRVLESTDNGFVLAEKDLELRGPGDFLGTRQSGLPELRIAHLGDIATLSLARQAAQSLFAEDATLAHYPQLTKQIARFWRGHGDVN